MVDEFASSLGYGSALPSSLRKFQEKDPNDGHDDWLFLLFLRPHPLITDQIEAIGRYTQRNREGTMTEYS